MVNHFSKGNRNLNTQHIRSTRNDSNNHARKKIAVIGNSMVKFLLSDEMSSYSTVSHAVNVPKHPGFTTDDM